MDMSERKEPMFRKKIWRYVTFFFAFAVIYYFSLRVVFPGYFTPFVPHHSDILDYPYDLAAGGVAGLASRPIGLILNAFFGLFGAWRGVVLAGLLCTVCSMLLIVNIVQCETGKKIPSELILVYGVLVLVAPTFYLNYSFDIFGTYALTLGLVAVRLTYHGKLQKNPACLYCAYFAVMLLGFLSKETYIVSFCFFTFGKALLSDRNRRTNWILFALTCAAGILSLLYGKILGSTFTGSSGSDVSSPYYISLQIDDLLRSFLFYAKGLVNIPVAIMLLVSTCFVIHSRSRASFITLLFCISGIFAYAPYSVLPNKLVHHYVFTAVPMLMAAVLLLELPTDSKDQRACLKRLDVLRMALVLFCVLVVISYSKFPRSYTYAQMHGWIQCEKKMEWTLSTTEEVSNSLEEHDSVLVLGLEDTVETAYRACHASKRYFPQSVSFDVLTDYPMYCGNTAENITYISHVDRSKAYNKIVRYSEAGVSVTDGDTSEILEDSFFSMEMPELNEEMIYPGIAIDQSFFNEDGSLNIAVVLEDINHSYMIKVNGVSYFTSFGDDFISATIPKQVVDSGSMELCLLNTVTQEESNRITLSVISSEESRK